MIARDSQRNAGQRPGKAEISIFKGLGYDPQGGDLVYSKDNKKVLRSMLLCQFFDSFLFRKTYGTCSGSDKAGGGLVDDGGESRLEAGADAIARYVVPFSKHDNLLVL